jgi:two-component system, OmpR family, response regulator
MLMTSKYLILIVDDDTKLCHLIANFLRQQGFDTLLAESGVVALNMVKRHSPDAIVLDLMLPDIDGFDLCRQIRNFSNVPVLMLTARDNDTDMVTGLNAGCDDYVAKPVEPQVLLARINALLRRASSSPSEEQVLRFGQLTIDKTARVVILNNENVVLTSYEFDLLAYLAQHSNEAINRETLFNILVGRAYDGRDRTIDIRISMLRKKLLDNTQEPFRIKTIWGQGYLFVATAWD